LYLNYPRFFLLLLGKSLNMFLENNSSMSLLKYEKRFKKKIPCSLMKFLKSFVSDIFGMKTQIKQKVASPDVF